MKHHFPPSSFHCGPDARGLGAALAAASLLAATAASAAPACGPAKIAEVLAPTETARKPVRIDCDLTLTAGVVVPRRLDLVGKAASGVTVDCRGGRLDGTVGAAPAERTMVAIRSAGRNAAAKAADRPEGVTIRNCVIHGGIRVWGLGVNGEDALVRQSSYLAGHTARAQAAAPTRVRIDSDRFEANGRIPVYLSPGVTEVSIENAAFAGTLEATAVYLDAESARNVIRNNRFDLASRSREVVAVDGSADNIIENNSFTRLDHGGIFLYRNCGEGGTVRHQPPTGNLISGNRFVPENPAAVAAPAVWIGSRSWIGLLRLFDFCAADRGHPFGSSIDDGDEANGNTVTGNLFVGLPAKMAVTDYGKENRIAGNTIRN